MKFAVDPKIFEKWPGVKIGILVLEGITNKDQKDGLTSLLREEEEKQKKNLTGKELGSLPEVAIWREVYRAFGSNPHDYKSSVEALLKRVQLGKPLPQINKLVDLYNFLSIKYHIPAGAEDLDKVKGDINLTFSDGTVKGKYIGSDSVETCEEGEVVYKDESGFICRRWNWREADRTKIEDNTQNAVLVLENASVEKHEDLEKALDETKELIEKYLGGKAEKFILTKDNLSLETSFKTGSKAVNEEYEVDNNSHSGLSRIQPVIDSGVATFPRMTDDQQKLPPEGTISYKIIRDIEKVLGELGWIYQKVSLEHPEDEKHGDYSTNIAMVLFGAKTGFMKAGKEDSSIHSPMDLATKIKVEIDEMKLDYIEKVEMARPGFINFWLSKTYLSNQLEEVIKKEDGYGRNKIFAGKKYMVEFAHPNTHKELHIGHMRTLIIGESLARIFKFSGADVFRANYQGDIGLHVAKAIYGTRLILKEKGMSFERAEKLSHKERVHILGEGYVRGNTDYENETGKKEIVEINNQIYRKDERVWSDYQRTRKWSLDYYDDFYKRFYTRYDQLFFESGVADLGKKNVLSNIGKVFQESQGAVIFPGSKYGLHDRVFITKDGNPTYEGKDMGLCYQQFAAFPFDKNIHVVSYEQKGYFQVIIKAMEIMDSKFIGRQYHLSMGMVQMVGEKMSSRTGKIITVDFLLDQVKAAILSLMKKEGLSKAEIEEISESVTIGAIKYWILKVDPEMDVMFDIKKSVSLEGDSGPYLQYTFARCESVLRKADYSSNEVRSLVDSSRPFKTDSNNNYNPEEMALLRTLYRFPEVVLAAGEKLAPNLICSFLFTLAQKYNNFYNKHSILKADSKVDRDFRLALTKGTATILKNGLGLLGIEAPRKM